MSAISKNLKKFRNEKNITQEDLANEINVTRQTISSWETGRTQPDIEMLESISEVLGVGIEELIYGKKNRVGLEPAPKKDRNIFAVVLSIFGSLLTAVGVVILFVSFWDRIGDIVKTVLAFLPLIAGFGVSFFSLTKKKNEIFNEGAAVVWAVGLMATNALLSALYCPELRADEIAVLDSIGLLLMAFVTGAVFPFVSFLATLTVSVISLQSYFTLPVCIGLDVFFVLMMAAGFVFLRKYDKKDARRFFSIQAYAAAALTGLCFICYNIENDISTHYSNGNVVPFILLSVGMALMIANSAFENTNLLYHGSLLTAGTTVFCTFVSVVGDTGDKIDPGVIVLCSAVSAVILCAGLIIGGKKLRENITEAVISGLGLLVLAVTAVLGLTGFGAPVVYVAITAAMGIVFILSGVRKAGLFSANLGVLMLCSVVMIFVFGSDIDTVFKGIITIAAGIVILLVNKFAFSKLLPEKEGEENA